MTRWKSKDADFKFKAHSICSINNSLEAKTLGMLIEDSKDSYVAHKAMSHLNIYKETLDYLTSCPEGQIQRSLIKLWFRERVSYWKALESKIPTRIFTFTLNVMKILYREAMKIEKKNKDNES